MSLFTWDEKYSVGDADLDGDHKKLFEILSTLHDAMTQGKGRTVVKDTVDELIKYTHYHFSREEKKLAEAGYHGLAGQQKAHAEFLSKAEDFKKKINEGKEQHITVNVSNMLVDWLKNHIGAMDSGYKSVISK